MRRVVVRVALAGFVIGGTTLWLAGMMGIAFHLSPVATGRTIASAMKRAARKRLGLGTRRRKFVFVVPRYS